MDPEEQELLSDYRYRSYSSVIEKALRNFESSSEWADLISSLGKLNKVLGHFLWEGSVGNHGIGEWRCLLMVGNLLWVVRTARKTEKNNQGFCRSDSPSPSSCHYINFQCLWSWL